MKGGDYGIREREERLILWFDDISIDDVLAKKGEELGMAAS